MSAWACPSCRRDAGSCRCVQAKRDAAWSAKLAKIGVTEMPPGPELTPEKRAAAMALVEREYQALALAGQLARQWQASTNNRNADLAQQACSNQARGQQFSPMAAAYETRDAKLSAEIETARTRIAELEACCEDRLRRCQYAAKDHAEERERHETLYGVVRNERDDLLRENAVLRRKLEAAERKAGKR